jgi:hypothetical protein
MSLVVALVTPTAASASRVAHRHDHDDDRQVTSTSSQPSALVILVLLAHALLSLNLTLLSHWKRPSLCFFTERQNHDLTEPHVQPQSSTATPQAPHHTPAATSSTQPRPNLTPQLRPQPHLCIHRSPANPNSLLPLLPNSSFYRSGVPRTLESRFDQKQDCLDSSTSIRQRAPPSGPRAMEVHRHLLWQQQAAIAAMYPLLEVPAPSPCVEAAFRSAYFESQARRLDSRSHVVDLGPRRRRQKQITQGIR